MPRPRRLNLPGATYHVMARGNRKQVIFDDDRDRSRFLWILDSASQRYDVGVKVYCLMGTHFHLVVSTPRGNLSAFMRQVDGTFTQYSNWRHERVGHLLQGPFKAVVVEGDSHLLMAIAYVLRNPVDAGYVSTPSDWKWSSYRATVGGEVGPVSLDLAWLLQLFPAKTGAEAGDLFHAFMHGPPSADLHSFDGPAIASAEFRRRLRSHIEQTLFTARVPRSYKALFRPSLAELFGQVHGRRERAQTIARAHVVHGYTLSEIADSLALHPGTVSRIYRALRRSGAERVEKMLKNGT